MAGAIVYVCDCSAHVCVNSVVLLFCGEASVSVEGVCVVEFCGR